MGIFTGKDKNGNLIIQMESIQGLPHTNAIYYLTLDKPKGRIIFQNALNKKEDNIYICFSDIFSVDIIKKEAVKKENPLGRGIAGGILFGKAGAMVGALTARDKTVSQPYRVITYNGSGLRRIVLKTRGDMREFKFFNELQNILSQNN